jgi:hypothetical protein
MTDSMNQVGKNLSKTKKTSEHISSRFAKNYPLVVSTRGNLHSQRDLNFEIKVYDSNQQTLLNLYFWDGPCNLCTEGG